jgi:hypothetical protein
MKECISDYKTNFGITSQTQDNQHIYMGDVDKELTFDEIMTLIKELHNRGLYEIILVESANGYNLFSLDKMSLKLVHKINDEIPFIDEQFNNLAYRLRKFYVLRIGPDKKVIGIYKNPCFTKPLFIKSNAHRKFFNVVYGLGLGHNRFYDDLNHYQIIAFGSKKHGYENLKVW